MTTLFALIIAPVLVLAVIILLLIWVTGHMTDRLVGRKHRWLEEILRTGAAPADWQTPFTRRMAHLKDTPAQTAQRDHIQATAQATYLRRLDELIRYIVGSPLVSDEETCETLLAQLTEVRMAWSVMKPDHRE